MANGSHTPSRLSRDVQVIFAALLCAALLGAAATTSLAASVGSAVTVTLRVIDSVGVSLTGEPSRQDGVIQIGSPGSGNVTYVVLDD